MWRQPLRQAEEPSKRWPVAVPHPSPQREGRDGIVHLRKHLFFGANLRRLCRTSALRCGGLKFCDRRHLLSANRATQTYLEGERLDTRRLPRRHSWCVSLPCHALSCYDSDGRPRKVTHSCSEQPRPTLAAASRNVHVLGEWDIGLLFRHHFSLGITFL